MNPDHANNREGVIITFIWKYCTSLSKIINIIQKRCNLNDKQQVIKHGWKFLTAYVTSTAKNKMQSSLVDKVIVFMCYNNAKESGSRGIVENQSHVILLPHTISGFKN
jgi:hypothetical protein